MITPYLFSSLESVPEILINLVETMTEEQKGYRPVPDRFSLTEAAAHLADWDPIFLMRIKNTIDQENFEII